MISEVKVSRDLSKWHRWFAWHPITVQAGKSNMYVWVWLHTVERKYVGSYDGWDPEYRMVKQ